MLSTGQLPDSTQGSVANMSLVVAVESLDEAVMLLSMAGLNFAVAAVRVQLYQLEMHIDDLVFFAVMTTTMPANTPLQQQ